MLKISENRVLNVRDEVIKGICGAQIKKEFEERNKNSRERNNGLVVERVRGREVKEREKQTC